MKLYGETGYILAEALGISANTLSKKINNKAEFTQSEIDKIKKKYDLTPAEIDSIFFVN